MLKFILVTVAGIIAVILVVAAMQPAEYRVVRTTSISAPADIVFAQLNDLRKWQEISPWAKLDPAAKNTFEGPVVGTGAALRWVGNSKVGEGRMTITESRPTDLLRMRLDFVKPFASTAMTEFTMKPNGNQTSVTWSMSGEKNFLSKAFCLFMNMDKMVGGQFEEGLANLKSLTEAASRQPAPPTRT
jgi:hypothetical protein